MSDSPSGAFQLLLDSHIISFIQNCTNVEARDVLRDKDWSVSCFELQVFIALLCVWGGILRGEYSFRQPLE